MYVIALLKRHVEEIKLLIKKLGFLEYYHYGLMLPRRVEVLLPCAKSMNAFLQQKSEQTHWRFGGFFFFLSLLQEQKDFLKYLRVEVLRDKKSDTWFYLLRDQTFDTITQTTTFNMLKSKKKDWQDIIQIFNQSKRSLVYTNKYLFIRD